MDSPFGRLKNIDPPTYQDKLADLIRVEKPNIVVETGVWEGLGSEYILKALDDNGKGHLYSIDPCDTEYVTNGAKSEASTWANPIVHPRYTLIKQLSQDALYPLFYQVGFFDLFIHDSDHSFQCQTNEYERAWEMVRPGGIIASDDVYWSEPPHRAWDLFLERHGIKERTIMGNAQYFRRPQ